MQKRIRPLLLIALATGLWACAPQIVPSSGPRPATMVAQIKIYQKEPSKYEKLGPVSLVVKSTTHWEATADATPAFDQLLEQAAAKGANGLLLIDDAHQEYMMGGALFQGGHYLVPLRREPLTVVAEAIYVLKE